MLVYQLPTTEQAQASFLAHLDPAPPPVTTLAGHPQLRSIRGAPLTSTNLRAAAQLRQEGNNGVKGGSIGSMAHVLVADITAQMEGGNNVLTQGELSNP